ncbi:MAG TPA: P-loop NTPase [Chloroflexi bacterium]|jgi:MinD superfamily P-loop ATPase|nr:P-loop NTPase [Chloroflexota bacterium]
MRIAVASGKGGTGKTLIATSLALTAGNGAGRTTLLDADVEAPNAALFVQPSFTTTRVVEQMMPVVDEDACLHCGRCAEVCQYHAIAAVPERTLVFQELCHGCGSCALACPANAICEVPRAIGYLEAGEAKGMAFAHGMLNVSEAMATPVIRALKDYALEAGWEDGLVIIDCPPGTSCPAIEALQGADMALLVTEPTLFGLHDLRLAVQVARDVLGLPTAVVINKVTGDDAGVESYCRQEGLPVLMQLPMRREIAAAYATGCPLIRAFPEWHGVMRELLQGVQHLARVGQP